MTTREVTCSSEAGDAISASVTRHTRGDESHRDGPEEWYTIIWEDESPNDSERAELEGNAIRKAFPDAFT